MNEALQLQKWRVGRSSLLLHFAHGGQLLSALAMGLVIVALLAGNPAAITALPTRIASLRADVTLSGGDIRDADPSSGKRQVVALTPEMRVALDFVSRRYRVSADALTPVFLAAQATGRQMKLDPLLIIAVIAIESRFNPFAESIVGAQGLMQIVAHWHQDKLPEGGGDLGFFDPEINVRVGAQILRDSIRRTGGLIPGLQYFAGALDDQEHGYANKILAEKQRLELAVGRGGA